MNERIRELAKQTGYIWHASGDPQIYEFTPEKLEKFAELIVQECATEILKWKDEPFPFDEDFAARLIMDHFGVKQ
jgi:hypothetical protein